MMCRMAECNSILQCSDSSEEHSAIPTLMRPYVKEHLPKWKNQQEGGWKHARGIETVPLSLDARKVINVSSVVKADMVVAKNERDEITSFWILLLRSLLLSDSFFFFCL